MNKVGTIGWAFGFAATFGFASYVVACASTTPEEADETLADPSATIHTTASQTCSCPLEAGTGQTVDSKGCNVKAFCEDGYKVCYLRNDAGTAVDTASCAWK